MVTQNETARNGLTKPTRNEAWVPSRGIRLFTLWSRPTKPHAVQWRCDGKVKTRAFATVEEQIAFGQNLEGDAKELGLAAYRLNPNEAREYRALRHSLGADVTIDDLLTCWERHGHAQKTKITVAKAVAEYMALKRGEGLAESTLKHYKPVFDHLVAILGERDVGAVSRSDIVALVAGVPGADYTRRTHQIRAKALFRWLHLTRRIKENPCDGLKAIRITPEEVQALTVEHTHSLFVNNESEPRELLGRLALECFAGLRFSSAAKTAPADIDLAARGVVLPAAKLKTRRRQYIDGLPDNLWKWLEWSDVSKWKMTERQYMEAKSNAFIRAHVPHPNNVCRHSFGTYHMAAFKDAGQTSAILCHTSPKMLYAHYKGRAKESDGKAYFQINPTS